MTGAAETAGALFQPNGCLTAAGFEALASTAPGGAPPELAQHVAACARCQDRWLRSTAGAVSPRASAASTARRRWGMVAVVLGVVAFALIALIVTLNWVTRR